MTRIRTRSSDKTGWVTKLVLTSLVLFSLTGCAALNSALRPKPPVDNQLTSIQPLPATSAAFVPLPALPQARVITDKNGKQWAAFDVQGMNQLRLFNAAAQANTKTGVALLTTSQAQVTERNSLLALAQQEQARSNFLANQWADAKEDANKQQLEKETSGWAYKAMLVLTIFLLR